mmetsp:Transcript_40147/g.126318  ORF Transcript_40147/g.126318 Transcript_40147/m.126318 type:complete len:83 (-) Transcript_40147:193-441(-)
MCAMFICTILSAVASEYFHTYDGMLVLVPKDIQLCARAFLTKYQIRHLLHTQLRDLHSIDCNHYVPTANSVKEITLVTGRPI